MNESLGTVWNTWGVPANKIIYNGEYCDEMALQCGEIGADSIQVGTGPGLCQGLMYWQQNGQMQTKDTNGWRCCAQQTGVHRMIGSNCLVSIYLPEEMRTLICTLDLPCHPQLP